MEQMIAIIMLEIMSEKKDALYPALGQNMASMKMPTNGPERAPNMLIHI